MTEKTDCIVASRYYGTPFIILC